MNISKDPCLAIVTKSFNGSNVGKICMVIRHAAGIPDAWDVEFPHPIQWETGHLTRHGYAFDSALREIKGEDESINTDTTEPINEEVKA